MDEIHPAQGFQTGADGVPLFVEQVDKLAANQAGGMGGQGREDHLLQAGAGFALHEVGGFMAGDRIVIAGERIAEVKLILLNHSVSGVSLDVRVRGRVRIVSKCSRSLAVFIDETDSGVRLVKGDS